jgi:lysozyme
MIDVYSGDGQIDWSAVRQAGHSAAICKATEGVSEIDARLSENLQGMKEAGVLRGAYHFFHVDQDPTQQAEHYLNALRDAGYDFGTDLPPAIDLEDAHASTVGEAAIIAAVAAFLQVIESHSARRSLIYVGKYWANSFLGDAFSGHPLWLAQYSDAPSLPDGWPKWAIWQYSETGSVPGVPNGGQTDMDRFCGDEDALRAWAATGELGAAPSTTITNDTLQTNAA